MGTLQVNVTTMKKTTIILLALAESSVCQSPLPQTVLTGSITPSTTCIPMALTVGSPPVSIEAGDVIYLPPEFMVVTSTPDSSASCINVQRGTPAVTAAAGTAVYVRKTA